MRLNNVFTKHTVLQKFLRNVFAKCHPSNNANLTLRTFIIKYDLIAELEFKDKYVYRKLRI